MEQFDLLPLILSNLNVSDEMGSYVALMVMKFGPTVFVLLAIDTISFTG